MSKLLSSENEDAPNETASFIAKVQSHMIETVRSNCPGTYKPYLVCKSCQISVCNQPHVLYCPKLIGNNELVTCIPEHQDICNDEDPKVQCFIARLMMTNLKKKKEIEEEN